MRTLIIFLLVLSIVAISCKQEVAVKKTTTAFDFLIGDWELTNEKGGISTSEHWKAIHATELRGHGYTLEDEDTVFNEKMRIIKKEDNWLLEVNASNEKPTVFTITSHDRISFTAVNPENEFPKEIRYSYFDDVLTATITGEDTEIPFIFWRME